MEVMSEHYQVPTLFVLIKGTFDKTGRCKSLVFSRVQNTVFKYSLKKKKHHNNMYKIQ